MAVTTDRRDRGRKDAGYVETKALGTSDATVTTTGFDLGAMTPAGAFEAGCELEISAPALNTTQLPNADTCTYSVESSVDSAFSSPIVVADKVLVQTGAGGAGAAAAVEKFKLASNIERYVRVKAVLAGTTGDCSGASMVVSLLF